MTTGNEDSIRFGRGLALKVLTNGDEDLNSIRFDLAVEKYFMGSIEYALSLYCRTHVLFSRWWPLGTIQYGVPFHLTNSSLVFNIEAFNFKSSMVTTKRNR